MQEAECQQIYMRACGEVGTDPLPPWFSQLHSAMNCCWIEQDMMKKIVAGLAGMLMAQCAFALSQCPADVKNCGPNPFYVIVVAFSQVCSGKFPENAPAYDATLAKVVVENPKAYANLDADPEFQEKLQLVRREIDKMSAEDFENECTELLKVNETSATLPK